MSDPRNVAHAKKVAEEKKHHGEVTTPEDGHAVQPGKKPAAARKKRDPAGAAVPAASETVEASPVSESPAPAARPAATLDGSLAVLTKLKEMETHARATLERLAELGLTVEDELKQKELAAGLSEVYSAQNAFETKLTAFIASYQTECDRLHGEGG